MTAIIFKSNKKISLFSVILFSFFFFSIIMIFITGGEAVVYYLHQDKTDSFMDLFYGIPEQKNNWHLSNYPALSMLPYNV